ncbi:MAG: type II toxin-antitoxin system RelE family toxin [Microcystaceae cyanobacterium]
MSRNKGLYLIQILPDVRSDIASLPSELQKKLHQYYNILSLDPYKTLDFPSHSLIGKLKGFRALEIDWNQTSYRLVYRIYEKPSPQRVVIVSFAEHDEAYFFAKQRK